MKKYLFLSLMALTLAPVILNAWVCKDNSISVYMEKEEAEKVCGKDNIKEGGIKLELRPGPVWDCPGDPGCKNTRL